MTSKYCIGIDLGTTNSVLAYSSLEKDRPRVNVLQVPQLVASCTVESRTMLPSFMYLGLENEARSGAFDVPWAAGRNFAVGEYARRQGAEVPDRTVGTAKSWLCYSQVDRRKPILPWNAPADVPKVSPLTASQRYLEHLAAAWENAFPDAPLAEQYVVLTVPASFDASARDLTREAALAAWPLASSSAMAEVILLLFIVTLSPLSPSPRYQGKGKLFEREAAPLLDAPCYSYRFSCSPAFLVIFGALVNVTLVCASGGISTVLPCKSSSTVKICILG